jgi:hypothetical protein
MFRFYVETKVMVENDIKDFILENLGWIPVLPLNVKTKIEDFLMNRLVIKISEMSNILLN